MTEVVGHFLKRPARFSCPMGKIVAQVMERHVVDEFGFCSPRPFLDALPPDMNAIFCPAPAIAFPVGQRVLGPLTGKDVGTLAATAFGEIVEQGPAGLVGQIDFTALAAFMADEHPASFLRDMQKAGWMLVGHKGG